MNIRTRRTVVATAAVAIAMGGLSAASAATNEVSVRQGDFITQLSDTRAQGKVDFLREGLKVVTGANTAATGPANNKAAEYFDIGTAMPTSGAIDWTGTTAQPGAQIVFATNGTPGSGDGYNVLVGEQVYSTNQPGQPLTDWWLTNGSGAAAKAVCPSTTGGSGSSCHGSLEDWAAALPESTVVYGGGFSLGSGVQGQGLLRSISYGDTTYTFTSDAEPEPPAEPSDVTAGATITRSGSTVKVRVDSDAVPAGKSEGEPVEIQVLQGPKGGNLGVRAKTTLGADRSFVWVNVIPAGSKQRVQVLLNGEKVAALQIP